MATTPKTMRAPRSKETKRDLLKGPEKDLPPYFDFSPHGGPPVKHAPAKPGRAEAPKAKPGRPDFPKAKPGRPEVPKARPGRPEAPKAKHGRPEAPKAKPGRPELPQKPRKPAASVSKHEPGVSSSIETVVVPKAAKE